MNAKMNHFEDNLSNIFNPKNHSRRGSTISVKSQTAEEIIDNINISDGQIFNNPKTIKRIETSYNYIRNLVHSLKGPINNNDDSFENVLKCLSYKENIDYKPIEPSIINFNFRYFF
jgi:hypothetical protein